MTDELKPCPFCGAELKAWTAVQYPKMALARIHPGSVEDGTCPIAGWGFYDEQIETWNTRAEDAALQQRVRELEEALGEISRRTGLLIHQNTGRWDTRLEHDRRTVGVLTVNQRIARTALKEIEGD